MILRRYCKYLSLGRENIRIVLPASSFRSKVSYCRSRVLNNAPEVEHVQLETITGLDVMKVKIARLFPIRVLAKALVDQIPQERYHEGATAADRWL